jgi:hypothetical protein
MSGDLPAQFRARQIETWQQARLWVILTAVGFIGGFIVGDLDNASSAQRWVAGLAFMAIIMLGIFKTVRVVLEHYRCPSCNGVVLEYAGVPLSPKACPRCHAPLR